MKTTKKTQDDIKELLPLGMTMRQMAKTVKKVTANVEEYVRENCWEEWERAYHQSLNIFLGRLDGLSHAKIAQQLGMSVEDVKARARRIFIKKDMGEYPIPETKGTSRTWEEHEDVLLTFLVDTNGKSLPEVAYKLGRTLKSIESRVAQRELYPERPVYDKENPLHRLVLREFFSTGVVKPITQPEIVEDSIFPPTEEELKDAPKLLTVETLMNEFLEFLVNKGYDKSIVV